MTLEKATPLRELMIEDMSIHGTGYKIQASHSCHQGVRHLPGSSASYRHARGIAAYQLQMTNTGVSLWTFNVWIVSLQFSLASPAGVMS